MDSATAVEQPHAPPPSAPDYTATRRVDLADLQELAPWLVERLQQRYADQSNQSLIAYLRSHIGQNDSLFIRRGNAVALARVAYAPLLPPRVEEVFVLAHPDSMQYAAELYDDIRRWAEGLNALEIVVERYTDVPRAAIKAVVGRIRTRDVCFVPLQ